MDKANASIHTVVSRAFQILSDPEKKRQYDQFGTDPDVRGGGGGGGGGGSPFSSFSRGGGGFPGARGGGMFDEEISPEDLFRQFFGGGGGLGGPFGECCTPSNECDHAPVLCNEESGK